MMNRERRRCSSKNSPPKAKYEQKQKQNKKKRKIRKIRK
jgi:hypothetical protein